MDETEADRLVPKENSKSLYDDDQLDDSDYQMEAEDDVSAGAPLPSAPYPPQADNELTGIPGTAGLGIQYPSMALTIRPPAENWTTLEDTANDIQNSLAEGRTLLQALNGEERGLVEATGNEMAFESARKRAKRAMGT